MVKRKQQWRKAFAAAEQEQQALLEAAEANKALFFEDREGEEETPQQPKAAKRRKVVPSSALVAKQSSTPAAAAAAGAGAAAAKAAPASKKRWQGDLELGGPERRTRKPSAAALAAQAAWTSAVTGANEKLPPDLWAQAGGKAEVNEKGFLVKTSAKLPPPQNLKVLREKPRLRSERRAADRQAPLEPAHAGSSFNPGEEERAELLEIASARLAEEEERKRRLDAALRRGPSNMKEVLAEWDRQSGRVPEGEGESDAEETAGDTPAAKEAAAAQKTKEQRGQEKAGDESDDSGASQEAGAPQPKSRRQRKKEKEHRQRLVEAALRRRELKAEKQIDRAHIIAKEVSKEEKRQQALAAERKAMLEARPELTPNLGTHAYEDIFPEVLLDDELEQGSLLQVKPSAHALRAQFKRFEKRALIEPISKATVSQEYSGGGYYKDKVRRRPNNNLKVINRK